MALAPFRAMASPIFFLHPFLFLAAAFQLEQIYNILPNSMLTLTSRVSHGSSSSKTFSDYFFEDTRIIHPYCVVSPL
jgi:hypothetical protein